MVGTGRRRVRIRSLGAKRFGAARQKDDGTSLQPELKTLNPKP